MTHQLTRRVLGIDPSTRGVAFAVLEGADFLVDWGIKTTTKADSERALSAVRRLVERFQPQILAIEDTRSRGSRRCKRIRTLLDDVAAAAPSSVTVNRIPARNLRYAEGQRKTKFERAQTLAVLFPELQLRLPRFRKPWMSEDERVNIFDALSLALACYPKEQKPPNETDLSA